MSDFGGSMVTQYYVLGVEHVNKTYKIQEIISATAHVLDDYVDQEDDRKSGQFNYFNDYADAEPITKWIERMQEARCYFHDVPATIRFIDGTCETTTLLTPHLYDLVYTDETNFEHALTTGTLLQPIIRLRNRSFAALKKMGHVLTSYKLQALDSSSPAGSEVTEEVM